MAIEFESIRIERIVHQHVPAPDCSFSDGALRAQMGFNMATAIITLIAPDAELAQRGDDDSCEINLVNNNGGDATLRFIYASRIDPDTPEARLTTDYALTITADFSPPMRAAQAEFAAALATDGFDWYSPTLIVGSGNGSRLGRRRHCESLRLDSDYDYGYVCRSAVRGRDQFDYERRGSVADLQCVAVASDRRHDPFRMPERRAGA